MADTARYVFQASRDAHTQITRMFDFVEPTAIAMWNLRWQVQGFLANTPQATSADISSRFSLGSGFRGGAIKRATTDTTWEQQKSSFANFVLINTIAAFEDFVAQIARVANVGSVSKDLQFPTGTWKGNPSGKSAAYSALGPDLSALVGVFNLDPAVSRRYSPNSIEQLLQCYRFFKEMRNCIAHGGSKADQKAVDAYLAFSQLSAADLGRSEVPAHSPVPTLGAPIALNLRGVIGFSDVVLRIVTTYDTDFSRKSLVETELDKRFSELRPHGWSVSRDEDRRKKHIAGRLKLVDLPAMNFTDDFISRLKILGHIPNHV